MSEDQKVIQITEFTPAFQFHEKLNKSYLFLRKAHFFFCLFSGFFGGFLMESRILLLSIDTCMSVFGFLLGNKTSKVHQD
jgi:hypothetical protein